MAGGDRMPAAAGGPGPAKLRRDASAGTKGGVFNRRWSRLAAMSESGVRARDAFLVHLDDATRPLEVPEEITRTAARLLGEHLGVDRCAYADVEADEDTFNLTGDYNRDVPSIVGRYRFA